MDRDTKIHKFGKELFYLSLITSKVSSVKATEIMVCIQKHDTMVYTNVKEKIERKIVIINHTDAGLAKTSFIDIVYTIFVF